jgi:hypothetical protein
LQIAIRVLIGALAGGAACLLLARTALCSAGICRTRAHWIGMTVAGAFFGAAVAWYLAGR